MMMQMITNQVTPVTALLTKPWLDFGMNEVSSPVLPPVMKFKSAGSTGSFRVTILI
ncbi:hypothetical protein [Bifidobacterium adolescentis]|uniref:hypothetical protein n=1 Tax=Bifidobacterium adolescentis TaxID=1680 RepID=UPI00216B4159|nr:hypothetical protein [Bifidobacterium adolescentis]